MKIQQIAAITVFAAITSACTDSTISHPETRTPPTAGAAYDGGIGLGSGGRAGTDTSGIAPTSSGTIEMTCGIGLGSGGRNEDCPTDPQ